MSLTPSSPRLPSPPPPAEIQLGPPSPSLPNTAATRQAAQVEQANFDANSKRRIHKGTRATDMAGPPLVPLNELDSAFQLQEHLAALHYFHTQSNTQPMTRTTSAQLATAPHGIDRTLWLYELCRFLISQCNTLIVGFLFDTPPCSAVTCPEMRASEWQFLCAVHEQPKSCCAIDYCCHTLDWAANVVTNPKLFPSRFVMHSDAQDKGSSVKALINVFRRLHRIFAHAWFQHRGVFWSVESQGGLYVFFKTVCDMYDLLPAENYKLPPEAEGLEGHAATTVAAHKEAEIKREQAHIQSMMSRSIPQRNDSEVLSPEDENYERLRNNTRRHIRSSPSTGSAVTTVMEADEEDGESGGRVKDPWIFTSEPASEEPEVAEVPVIVEHGMVDEPKTLSEDDSSRAKPDEMEQETSEDDEAETTVLEVDDKQGQEAESSSEDEIKSSEDEDEESDEAESHAQGRSEESADREEESDDEKNDGERIEELGLPLRPKEASTKDDGIASISVKDFADSSTAEPTPDASPESSEAGASDKAGLMEEAKGADAEDEDEDDDDSDDETDSSSQTTIEK